jgi:hypothetical protein
MHAIERPRLPRISVLAVGAVLLAIVVLLLAAARVRDISLSSGSAPSGAKAGPPVTIHSARRAGSSWVTSAFAVQSRVVLPWNTTTRR